MPDREFTGGQPEVGEGGSGWIKSPYQLRERLEPRRERESQKKRFKKKRKGIWDGGGGGLRQVSSPSATCTSCRQRKRGDLIPEEEESRTRGVDGIRGGMNQSSCKNTPDIEFKEVLRQGQVPGKGITRGTVKGFREGNCKALYRTIAAMRLSTIRNNRGRERTEFFKGNNKPAKGRGGENLATALGGP